MLARDVASSRRRQGWERTRSGFQTAGRLAVVTALAALSASAVTLVGASAAGAAPTPATATTFSCTVPTIFLAQGTPETELYSDAYSAGSTSFTPIGGASGWKYNALGFDAVDGYLYASSLAQGSGTYPPAHLLRIDDTGAVTDLGLFPDLPQGSTAGWVAGGFDDTPGAADGGVYYATDPGTVPSSELYELSISPSGVVGTAKTLTMTLGGRTFVPELFDITYSAGYLWGIDASSENADIDRIDPTNGDVTQVAQSVLPTGTQGETYAYGANWTLGNGNLGFGNNDTGEVYQVAIANPATTPTFSLVSSAAGPTAANNNDGASCPGNPADVGIVKSGPASVLPGGAVTYGLDVTNHGPGISSGYVVADAVPPSISDVASSTPGCAVTGNDVSCVEGGLGVGAGRDITITGKASTAPGLVTNTATVTGNEADPNAANNSSSVTTAVGDPDVTLSKSASSLTPADGTDDTFTLAAGNTGPSASGKVVVTDVLPAGLSYVSSSASTGSVVVSGQTVTWSVPDLAAVGATPRSATLDITVLVSTTSTVDNTATFTEAVPNASGATTGTSNTVSLKPTYAVIALTKAVSDVAPTVGSVETYTITVTDSGPDAATGVVVSDPLPSGLNFSSLDTATGTATESVVDGVQTISWQVGTLAVGAAATLQLSTTVTASSGSIVNTAQATSTTFDPSGQTQSASATAQVSAAAVVPPTHTGEPWAGGDYWLIVGGAGLSGAVLLTSGRRRRRRRPAHAPR
jgi:uncharacterized repeat protein (TIGR01451 family)